MAVIVLTAGTSRSTNQLDAKTLDSALRHVNLNLKPSFLSNILSTFADNSSLNNAILLQLLNRTTREAEIEEDAVTNQNNPNGYFKIFHRNFQMASVVFSLIYCFYLKGL